MPQVVRKGWVNRLDEVELDVQLKQLMATLEQENDLLKSLIARYSNAPSGSLTARRLSRWITSLFK
jgi:hypothetical protein